VRCHSTGGNDHRAAKRVSDEHYGPGAVLLQIGDSAQNIQWAVEQFFKDCQQLLGLGQYQNRSYGAAVTHLHLVCFADALLTTCASSRQVHKARVNIIRLLSFRR
jgi:hypothetical protein